MDKPIDIVKLSRLKHVISSAEKHNHDDIDMDISFEFIIASCFPKIYDNIKNRLAFEHTQGYIEGREDMKNEIKGIS